MNERIWNQRMLGLTFNVEDGRITIFRSTLEALGWPTHYRFLYNREAKQVAVQNCTAEDAGAHKTPKLTVSNSCEIKCVALVRMIYRDMRWNRDNTYRLEGKSIPRQQLVSFDLDTPFLVENGKALGENPSLTEPLCGEGLSAAESSSASPIKRDSGYLSERSYIYGGGRRRAGENLSFGDTISAGLVPHDLYSLSILLGSLD